MGRKDALWLWEWRCLYQVIFSTRNQSALRDLGVAYLESTRIASSFDVRPMFKYLNDEGISTSSNLR